MLSVTLLLAQHKHETRIFIDAPVNNEFNQIIRRLPGILWSKTKKQWHLPFSNQSVFELKNAIKHIAAIDSSQLMQQLPITQQLPIKQKIAQLPKKVTPKKQPLIHTLNPDNLSALEELVKHLILKAYSPNTIKTYKNEFMQLLLVLEEKKVQQLTTEQLKRYLLWCIANGLTENSVHSRMNALKFYFEQVLKHDKLFFEIPRPKKPLILPKVISEEKIIKGLLKIENLKHKTLLLLAYSAGLRVSEVISLQITDINSDRMQININRAKGKKDRVVTLSKNILELLREYYKIYHPVKWLFEGQKSDEHYSARSAQIIFKDAYKDLGLPLQCSFHSLRHSFATHLLENGTDISYIQKILGHNDIRTTLRYAQVSNKDITKIESPLDKIMRKNSGL